MFQMMQFLFKEMVVNSKKKSLHREAQQQMNMLISIDLL